MPTVQSLPITEKPFLPLKTAPQHPARAISVLPPVRRQLLEQLEELTPDALLSQKRGLGQILVAGVLRKANLPDSAQHVLDRVDFSEQADPPRLLHQYEAAMLATTGDPDGAMDALMRWAVTTPDVVLGSQGSLHWWWRTLQNRPDFQQFIERN